MATVSVPDELDRIIREALTGPPQSSSRLRPVDRRLAELLGLDPEKVRAKVVDDAGVVENRLGEGGIVNRKPDLVAILLQNESAARSDGRKGRAADRARNEHRRGGDLRRRRPGMGGRGTRRPGGHGIEAQYPRVVSRGRGQTARGSATSTPFER